MITEELPKMRCEDRQISRKKKMEPTVVHAQVPKGLPALSVLSWWHRCHIPLMGTQQRKGLGGVRKVRLVI